jgi:hypothetical protein
MNIEPVVDQKHADGRCRQRIMQRVWSGSGSGGGPQLRRHRRMSLQPSGTWFANCTPGEKSEVLEECSEGKMHDFQETLPVVFSRSDGDVEVAWMSATSERVQVRRFRAHLGHVVEVTDQVGRLVRVGPGLVRQGCLRLQDSLEQAIRGALEAADETRSGDMPHAHQAEPERIEAEAAGASPSVCSEPALSWRRAWLKLLPGHVTTHPAQHHSNF